MEATILIGYVTGALAMMAYCVWGGGERDAYHEQVRRDNVQSGAWLIVGLLWPVVLMIVVPAAFIEWRRERRMDNASRRR